MYLWGRQGVENGIDGRVNRQNKDCDPNCEVTWCTEGFFQERPHSNRHNRHPADTVGKNNEEHPFGERGLPPQIGCP